MVLLGVVIVLGMLVDDAVVVVEGIYYRLRHGMDAMSASIEALREVAAPVTAAVLTTMAAFAPLILLPGILGDFMRVVPTVVVIALAISLVEAFWMLPAHVIAAGVSFERPSAVQRHRERFTHWIQIRYVRLLVKALRHRWLTLLLVLSLFLGAVGSLGAGLVRMDFFAADTMRLFYINVECHRKHHCRSPWPRRRRSSTWCAPACAKARCAPSSVTPAACSTRPSSDSATTSAR